MESVIRNVVSHWRSNLRDAGSSARTSFAPASPLPRESLHKHGSKWGWCHRTPDMQITGWHIKLYALTRDFLAHRVSLGRSLLLKTYKYLIGLCMSQGSLREVM